MEKSNWNTSDILFISWEFHRRSKELCKYFDFKHSFLQIDSARYIRYPYCLLVTLWSLMKNRPRVLIVQNPSIVLALVACLFRPFFCYKLIVDAHNGAIIPDVVFWSRFRWIYVLVQRLADMTIVTNKYLADIVKKNGGNVFVLPDKLPEVNISSLACACLESEKNILFVCSFSEDEPYEEVIRACSMLQEDVTVYITGRVNENIREWCVSHCSKIKFTGFLNDLDYFSLMLSVDLVIDLTLRKHCLVCASYEAVAVGTPLLLSDTSIQRDYFYKGCIFTDCYKEPILNSIKLCLENKASLTKDIGELKVEINYNWKRIAVSFMNEIESLVR